MGGCGTVQEKIQVILLRMIVNYYNILQFLVFIHKENFQSVRFLHIIILNAGVFGIPFQLTKDNYETTFQVNHLSQFYLTLLLKDIIQNSSNPRVVIVSSESHR